MIVCLTSLSVKAKLFELEAKLNGVNCKIIRNKLDILKMKI